MATLTLTARTDLTYEEIYEGYANGKSRLPKIVKQIENGAVALAETTGVDIKRRRTSGGNAETPGNVGQTDSAVVAKLISAARWDTLIAGYSGPGDGFVTPPSYNLQVVDVRAVIKNPFDLIDEVGGINYADQIRGAAKDANTLTGRATKIQEYGTGVRIREIDRRAPLHGGTGETGPTADIDVTDYYTYDRIGGGGATGEVHGVDQDIPEVIVADSESHMLGISATNYDMSGDTTLSFELGSTGSPQVDVVFESRSYTKQEVIDTINDAVDDAFAADRAAEEFYGTPANDPVCVDMGGPIELHSRNRGLIGNSGLSIVNDNSVLGFTSIDDQVRGATVGDVEGVWAQTVVDLSPEAVGCRTTLRYGTVQFGVLQVVGTTNGLTAATASAYIVHPDFLEDLIAYQ